MPDLAGRPPLGPKQPKAKRDPSYLARVVTLPCVICQRFGMVQIGRSYAHHTICGRYSQRKTPDRDAIPLCYSHHQGEWGIHTDKAAWVEEYGPDTDFIAQTRAALGE
jgi:hypothetical protein